VAVRTRVAESKPIPRVGAALILVRCDAGRWRAGSSESPRLTRFAGNCQTAVAAARSVNPYAIRPPSSPIHTIDSCNHIHA